MTVGERIKQLRLNRDITQVQLSDIVGITKQLLYKYENNIITNIPSDKIYLIAQALTTTPAYLMGWDDKTSCYPEPLFTDKPDENSKKLLQIMQQLPDEALDKLLDYALYLEAQQHN